MPRVIDERDITGRQTTEIRPEDHAHHLHKLVVVKGPVRETKADFIVQLCDASQSKATGQVARLLQEFPHADTFGKEAWKEQRKPGQLSIHGSPRWRTQACGKYRLRFGVQRMDIGPG